MKQKGFVIESILIIICIIFISIIGYHIYKMNTDEEYRFAHSSITHGNLRYRIQNDNLLIIEKRFLKKYYVYNIVTKAMMPQTTYKYKVIHTVPFEIPSN